MDLIKRRGVIDLKKELGAYPKSFHDLSFRSPGDSKGKRFISGTATTADTLDLNGVVISKDALRSAVGDLLEYNTILMNHDMTAPIGRVTDTGWDEDRGALLFEGFISQDEDTIWRKIEEEILNRVSITWRSLEYDIVYSDEFQREVIVVTAIKILEVSVVSVGADADAKIEAFGSRLVDVLTKQVGDLQIDIEHTRALRPNRAWDAVAAVKRVRAWAGGPTKDSIDWAEYARAFALNTGSGTYRNYDFLHHDVFGGELVSNLRAVRVAADRLIKSSLPEEEKRQVAQHLMAEFTDVHQVDEKDLPSGLAGLSE